MLTPERKQQINEMCGAISLRLRRDEVRKDDLAVLLILIAECQGEADAHRQMVSALTARCEEMEAALRMMQAEAKTILFDLHREKAINNRAGLDEEGKWPCLL